jgi:predicted Zn-dependent protease
MSEQNGRSWWDDGARRVLSREACEEIAARVQRFASGGGSTGVTITSWWNGELRWGRNEVTLASDRRSVVVEIERTRLGGPQAAGTASCNQLDDESLRAAVRAAEWAAGLENPTRRPPLTPQQPDLALPETRIWSDTTHDVPATARGEVARAMIEPAAREGMLSAGYLEVRTQSVAQFGGRETYRSHPLTTQPLYAAATQAQCSLTVRNRAGNASGWAGASSYDWNALATGELAARALEKCRSSADPVAIEPGRYTVILEPQAVHDLIQPMFRPMEQREHNEAFPSYPFHLGMDEALGIGRTKLGRPIMDRRLSITHDPADPLQGVLPFNGRGDPYRPITLVENGVITALAFDRYYAAGRLNEQQPLPFAGAYRMTGGDTSVEEMIRSTRRGLLVTRLSNVRILDLSSMLCAGHTRDGLWLIENGRISRPVRNFRFVESSLVALNSIEQIGPAVPVFHPARDPAHAALHSAIVPALKVRDFSFTSSVDAI